MAAMAGSSGTGIYSKAISRSPVTDWRYYGEYRERGSLCVCVFVCVCVCVCV